MRDTQLLLKKEFTLFLLLLILLIDPYEKGFYMCFIFAIYFFTVKLTFTLNSLDKYGILLILFSLSYSLIYFFNPGSNPFFVLVYAVSPITFYTLGKYFLTRIHSNEIFLFILIFLSLSYSFLPTVSIMYQIIENGFVGERDVRLFTRDSVSGATLLGSYFTMNMAVIGTIFVKSSNFFEKRVKFVYFGTFIISLLCVLRIASRTQMLIALISIVVIICYLIFKQSPIKSIQLLLSAMVTLVVAFVGVSSNTAVLNILNQRNNSEEELMGANGRTILWDESLKNLTTKPFGWEMSGNAAEISEYSHNLWLDVDRVAGIIPFIFLSLFTTLCIGLVLKVIKISPSNWFFNSAVLVWFTGLTAVFFVEPVMEGLYSLFLIFCIYIGMLSEFKRSAFPEKINLKRNRVVFDYRN